MSEKPKLYITQFFETANLPNCSKLMEMFHVVHRQQESWCTHEDLLESLPTVKPDALLVVTRVLINKAILDAAGTQLKIVSLGSVGYDLVDLDACKEAGVTVTNTPDVLTDSVAELTIGLLIATARKFKNAFTAVVNGVWRPLTAHGLLGKDIKHSTVGIVGLGRIGSAVAKRLKAFDVAKIVYQSRNESPYAVLVGAEKTDFQTLLKMSDIVIVCCALTGATKGLFGKESFKLMRPDAIFINISRGAVVNQDDLYDALVTGEILAAGLDVTTPEPLPPNSPLLKLDNCCILPHIAPATYATVDNLVEHAAENIIAYFTRQALPSPILF